MQVRGSGIWGQAFQRACTSLLLTLALASRMVVSVLNQCPSAILVTEAGPSTDRCCSPSWPEHKPPPPGRPPCLTLPLIPLGPQHWASPSHCGGVAAIRGLWYLPANLPRPFFPTVPDTQPVLAQ